MSLWWWLRHSFPAAQCLSGALVCCLCCGHCCRCALVDPVTYLGGKAKFLPNLSQALPWVLARQYSLCLHSHLTPCFPTFTGVANWRTLLAWHPSQVYLQQVWFYSFSLQIKLNSAWVKCTSQIPPRWGGVWREWYIMWVLSPRGWTSINMAL